jgi:hypothetical protein
MERVTRNDLAQAPEGRYVAGDTFAHFCAEPRVWGVLLWGRPTRDDVAALVGSLAIELAAPAQPHASVVDCGRLESVDPPPSPCSTTTCAATSNSSRAR